MIRSSVRVPVWLVATALMTASGCAGQSPPRGNPPPSPTSARCSRGIFIPSGRATLGGTDHGGTPPAEYEVGAFCIDEREVSANEVDTCVALLQCSPRPKPCFRPDAPGLAGCLTFSDLADYCRSKSGRIPTDEEWEVAARGRDGRVYPWGNDDLGEDDLDLPTGHDISPFGVRGMVSGLKEWTSTTSPPGWAPPGTVTPDTVWYWVRGDPGLPVWSRTSTPADAWAPRIGGRCAYVPGAVR